MKIFNIIIVCFFVVVLLNFVLINDDNTDLNVDIANLETVHIALISVLVSLQFVARSVTKFSDSTRVHFCFAFLFSLMGLLDPDIDYANTSEIDDPRMLRGVRYFKILTVAFSVSFLLNAIFELP